MLIGKADSLITKTAFITGVDQLYSHHFALVADHFSNLDEAYNVVEQGRGRAIVDLLVSRGGVSPQAVETERIISKLRLKMKSLRSLDEIRRQREAIFLAEEARAVNRDLTILGTKQFRPIPPKEIQLSLDPSESLLEYVVAEPNSCVLVLTSNTQQIIKLAGRKRIEKMVAEYTMSVKRRNNAKLQARDLNDTLLHPIPQIESKSRYVVIPDGCLNLLPFNALGDYRVRYVVQSHVVTYAPSSTTLYLLRSKELIGKTRGGPARRRRSSIQPKRNQTKGDRAGVYTRSRV
jgi:CHAT domain-containing protein